MGGMNGVETRSTKVSYTPQHANPCPRFTTIEFFFGRRNWTAFPAIATIALLQVDSPPHCEFVGDTVSAILHFVFAINAAAATASTTKEVRIFVMKVSLS